MAESVTGALAGFLFGEGRLSVDRDPLMPSWTGDGDPRAESPVDDLLRMTSGLLFAEDYGDLRSDVVLRSVSAFRRGMSGLPAAGSVRTHRDADGCVRA